MKPKFLTAKNIEATGKKVLIRGDLDVDNADNPRVDSVRQIVQLFLSKHASRIKVIAHRETSFDICSLLFQEFPGVEFYDRLRDNPGEKGNDLEFAQALADEWDIYINEAFATSHRKHASIVALPRVMRALGRDLAIGERFAQELLQLDKIWSLTGNKTLVIGGAKTGDKAKYADLLAPKFFHVLRGGLLAGADLRPDNLDISDTSISNFKLQISNSATIVVAGPMGKYEDPTAQKGTEAVFTSVADSTAYKVAGGGDTEAALAKFGLTQKFDWISVGGGAMLEYLSSGSLIGLDAISQS